MSQIIILISYVITTSLGLIALKLSSTNGLPVAFIDNKLALSFSPMTVLGVVMYGVSFLLYFYLISKFDLGFIIPLTTALVYIVIFMASFFIFKEAFTVMKVAAISLIIFGVILLNFNK